MDRQFARAGGALFRGAASSVSDAAGEVGGIVGRAEPVGVGAEDLGNAADVGGQQRDLAPPRLSSTI